MQQKKKHPKVRGKIIVVSPKAYDLIWGKAKNSEPKQTLRQYINSINGLPKEE